PAVQGAVGRGHEGVGAGPQRVAGAKAQGAAGEVQRRRGIAYRHGMARAAVAGQRLLELLDDRPLGDEVRAQHTDHGRDVGLGNILPRVGNGRRIVLAVHQAQAPFMARNSATVRKCGLLPELYSKSASTGAAFSPSAFLEYSTAAAKRMAGLMT